MMSVPKQPTLKLKSESWIGGLGSLPKPKGKMDRREDEFLDALPPHDQSARTHDTKRNDFPVGLTPPHLRSDIIISNESVRFMCINM